MTADKYAEVRRLAQQCADLQDKDRLRAVADLLSEIGVIHPTPDAKHEWIRGTGTYTD